MKKFEKMYQDYFNNVNLTREEKMEIKEKIINKKKKKFIFKLAYIPTIFICVLLIGGIMVVTANSFIRQFRVQENKTVILENNKLDIDCNSIVLSEDRETLYTQEELESLFEIKILKNSKRNSGFYKLFSLKTNDDKIARVHFDYVDNHGRRYTNDVSISFGFKTKYYDEDEMDKLGDMWISGSREEQEVYYHYMKALDTEAVILSVKGDTAPIMASFVYDNVVYSLDTNKLSSSIEDVYSYLDSFTK